MIYKWNKIKAETFKEIFDTFWNKNKNTVTKVLEIKNLATEDTDEVEPVRLFFGNGIRIEEWQEYNESACEMIKEANELLSKMSGTSVDIGNECVISMCMTNEGSPNITPLRTKSEHDDLIFKGMIDNNPESITNPRARQLSEMSKGFLKIRDDEGYVQARAIDLGDWKKHIKHYTKTGMFKEEFINETK